jgi:hypothetical protein
VKTLFLDAGDANMDVRRGSLAPLLGRSSEIVDFLQCDAWPAEIKSAEPCAALKKQ